MIRSDKQFYFFSILQYLPICLIKIVQYFCLSNMVDNIIEGQVYKLFYLIDDYTNSVFQKVFICDKNTLKTIQHRESNNLKIYGLIGPVKQINNHLINYYSSVTGEQRQNIQINFNNNLDELKKQQKAAVYMIRLGQNKSKSAESTIFLALISNDDLYYKKPINQSSLAYLLLRFIGDLCDDIIILYDDQIWNNFENQCPYSLANNNQIQFTIQKISVHDINIRKLKCQSTYMNYLSDEIGKIDYKNSLVISLNSHLQYFKKIDEKQLKIRQTSSKKSAKQKMWKELLQNGDIQAQLDNNYHKDYSADKYEQAVLKIKNIYKEGRETIKQFSFSCIKDIEKQINKQQSKDIEQAIIEKIVQKQNFQYIYYQAVLNNQQQFKIKDNHFVEEKSSQKTVQNLSLKYMEIFQSLYPNSKKSLQQKASQIKQKVQIQWKACKKNLIVAFQNFFQPFEYLNNLMENVYTKIEKIQVFKFDMIKVMKDSKIEKIQFIEQPETIIKMGQLKKLIPNITLSSIVDMKIFNTKFLRNCKLALISRQLQDCQTQEPRGQRKYQYTILSIQRDQLKLIAKYQQYRLIFTFDEVTRKVYLFKPSDKILITFTLDDYQKSKNQKRFNLTQKQQNSNFEIISYSISKVPNERFYFIDSRKDTLYCYDITQQSLKQIYTEIDESTKNLSCPRGGTYEMVKAFNHNIFLALGNSQIINIFKVDNNSVLIQQIVHSIECGPSQVYFGMGTYSDEINEYLVVYQKHNFIAFSLQNMSSSNMLRQNNMKVCLGNPIIDIFYEAKDRFGLYTTYTVNNNTPLPKKLHFHHILPNKNQSSKLVEYLKQSQLQYQYAVHFYYQNTQTKNIYDGFGLKIGLTQFLNEAESRIPIQICAVQYGNIIPLRDGNQINNLYGQKGSIEQRCKDLAFGVVERLLLEEPKKKTIVVSVMGAQSTGKSYLMNRIFGTRFTVASCRTTIGIWMSLIKTQDVNFIALDCQGLFSVHRELNEEQKLIKILTGISDFTILNQNKSMANKSLTDLMKQISQSIKVSQIKSQQLYNGSLVIVVRDVVRNQQKGIYDQFNQNFHRCKEIQEFMFTLFNKNNEQNSNFSLNYFPPFTQVQSFAKQTQKLRDSFLKKSRDKQGRTSSTILKWLKIIMTQLSCDDVNLPEQVMTKINLQKVQQATDKAWRNGKQQFEFEEFINKNKFILKDTLITIQQSKKQVSQYDMNCIQTIIKLFNQNILSQNPINSVVFSEVYTKLNQYIINFFNQRYSYAMEILKAQVKSLQNKNQKFKASLAEKQKQIQQSIAKQKEKLRLCLNQCSEKQICDQICIKKSDHKAKIQQKKKYVNNKLTIKRQWLKKNKLSEEQQNNKILGIKAIVQQCDQKLAALRIQEQRFKLKQKLSKMLQQQEKNLVSINKSVKTIEQKIVNNSKHFQQYKNAISSLRKVLSIYIGYIETISRQGDDRNHQQIIQLKNNRDKVQKYLQQLEKFHLLNEQIEQTKTIQIFFQEMDEQQRHIQETVYIANKEYKSMLNIYEQNEHKSSFIETKKIAIELELQEQEKKKTNKNNIIKDKKNICEQYQKSIKERKQKNEENRKRLDDKKNQLNKFEQQNENFGEKVENFNNKIRNLKIITDNCKFNDKGISQFVIPSIMSLYQQKILFQKMKKNCFELKQELKQIFKRFDCQQEKDYNQKLNKIERLIKANCIKLNSKKNDKNQQQIQFLNKQNFMIREIKVLQKGLEDKMIQHNQKVKQLINQLFQQQQYKQQKQFIEYICLVSDKFYNNPQFRLENYKDFYNFDLQFAIRQNLQSRSSWKEMVKIQYDGDAQKFKTALLATNQDELRTKIQQLKPEAQQVQSLMHDDQNEEKLQQLSQKLASIEEKIQNCNMLLEIWQCLKIDAIGTFERCINLLCQPQAQAQEQQQSSTISEKQQNNEIKKQIIISLIKQLQQKNPNLTFKQNQANQIHSLQMGGQFSFSLSQLVQFLKNKIKQMQTRLYPQLSVQDLCDDKLEQQYINNIRGILTNHSQRYYHYWRYFRDLSKLFKAGNEKQKFPLKLLYKWDSQTTQNQKLSMQNKKKQFDVFFNILLTVIFQICQFDSKLKKEYLKYSQQLEKQQQKYQKLKHDQSKYNQLHDQLSLRIKQIEDQIDQQSTRIIEQQLLLEQQKQKINQVKSQIKVIDLKISQLNQQKLTKIKEFQQISIQLQKSRLELDISKNKSQILCEIRQQLPNINYNKRVKDIINKYAMEIQENKQYKQQIQIQKEKAAEIQIKKNKIQQSIATMKKQLQQLNQKQILQKINQVERKIKKLEVLSLKLAEIQKNQKQVKQLLNELKEHQKSLDNFCSCKTNHKCDMKCEVGCVDAICSGKGGHKGFHVCSLQSHRCNKKCQVDPRCNNGCQEMVNHSQDTRHKCSNTHKCKQKCRYCEKICSVSQYQMHELHKCEESKCKKACILCGDECSSTDHCHDDEAEEVTRFKKLKNNEYQQRKQKIHLCGKQHKCQSLCVHPGVCSNKYCPEKRPWIRNGINIGEYQYVKQIQQKNQCTKIIPKGVFKHEQQCCCNANHICNHRCPDCQSLCYKNYNHSPTQRHQTKHRNQQSLIYAAQSENQLIKVQSDNQQFIFDVGQQSLPFKCDKSCDRKGRGHFHLVQCPGEDKCYEKTIKYGAKHSDLVYQPHVDKKYDKLLCTQYWQLFNFEMPSSNKEFGLCNFACTVVQDHKNKQLVYCGQSAWHSMQVARNKHKFDCDNYHPKLTINAYEICFLIDATGSMADYITQSMKIIKAIVANVKKIQQKINVKFAVVGYRDHKISQSQLFRDLRKQCVKKKKELSEQLEQQCHQVQMTQSAFEDKLINLQKNYTAVKNQEDFIQKFTEQQRFILKYHYPFVLDIKSSRRFLDENRRPNTMHYQLIRQYQKSQKKTLKQFIQFQLDYFISIMEEQVRQQTINSQKWKLLEVQPFTTAQTCIKFLQKLSAGGGGDPPEAVFDGMNAAANLNWTVDNNTSRYIFHLFDAPPHGQKYDTNNEDYFPEGCPCGIDLNSVINKLMRNKINYYIYPLTHRVKKTMTLFEIEGLKFKQQSIQKQNPKQFTDHVSSLICKQMEQNEIMVRK